MAGVDESAVFSKIPVVSAVTDTLITLDPSSLNATVTAEVFALADTYTNKFWKVVFPFCTLV